MREATPLRIENAPALPHGTATIFWVVERPPSQDGYMAVADKAGYLRSFDEDRLLFDREKWRIAGYRDEEGAIVEVDP